jgi:acyl-coenzyme A thioesterase 9
MREAYQLAYANASLFSKRTPRICVVDNISFKKPVLIGSLLFLSSQIVYTQDNFMQVKVHAETVDLKTNKHEMTNDFYFKFSVPLNYQLTKVIPKTYSEAMMYIDGKRHM